MSGFELNGNGLCRKLLLALCVPLNENVVLTCDVGSLDSKSWAKSLSLGQDHETEPSPPCWTTNDSLSNRHSITLQPVLPIDALEGVINQASDDTASLRSLSLTCSSFLPRARYHLFSGVRIATVQQLESSAEFLDSRLWLAPLIRIVMLSGNLQFSPDGSCLAWRCKSPGRCIIWRPLTAERLKTIALRLRGKDVDMNAFSFDPEGRRIATAHERGGRELEDYAVRIWDVATGAALASLAGHSQCIREVSFAPDGASLLSASRDGSTKIWDTDSWAETASLKASGGDSQAEIYKACFSPDGKYLRCHRVVERDGAIVADG